MEPESAVLVLLVDLRVSDCRSVGVKEGRSDRWRGNTEIALAPSTSPTTPPKLRKPATLSIDL